MIYPDRLHPMIYTLITSKLTTLCEIKNMSIEEALDLYEACKVHNYNKSLMIELSSKKP